MPMNRHFLTKLLNFIESYPVLSNNYVHSHAKFCHDICRQENRRLWKNHHGITVKCYHGRGGALRLAKGRLL